MPIYERNTIEKVVIIKIQAYMQAFDPWTYLKWPEVWLLTIWYHMVCLFEN